MTRKICNRIASGGIIPLITARGIENMSVINSMVDKACGLQRGDFDKLVSRQKEQQRIMNNLFGWLNDWYQQPDNIMIQEQLRSAWEAVLEMDAQVK